MKLSSSSKIPLLISDCSLKNTSFLTRKVLIINTNETSIKLNEFDHIYDDFLVALQEESKMLIVYFYSSLEINFQAGNHYILRSSVKISQEELFRRMMVDTLIKPFLGEKVVLIMKTNEFYIFISKKLIIENIDFIGNDIHVQNDNDPLACYNDIGRQCCSELDFQANYSNNDSVSCALNGRKINNFQKNTYYALFNLELIFDNFNNFSYFNDFPNIIINNCSFKDFFPLNSTKGWTSLFTIAPLGGLLAINDSVFDNFYFPSGLVYYKRDQYDALFSLFINYIDFNDYVMKYHNVSINNTIIMNYNQYFIEKADVSVINFIDFKGTFYIEKLLMNQIFNSFYVFYFEKSKKDLFSSVFIRNCTFSNMKNIGIFYFNNLNQFAMQNLNVFSINNTIILLISLKNIDSLILTELFFNKITNPTINTINILDSYGAINNSLFELSSQITLLYVKNGNFLIKNCTFQNLTFVNNIVSMINQTNCNITSSNFAYITGTVSLLYISASNTFFLLNTIIKYVKAYSIYYLETMNFNYNSQVLISFNTMTYFWKNDHSCKTVQMENSSFISNSIGMSVFSNLGVPNTKIFLFQVDILHNIMTVRPIIKTLEGLCNLTNVTVIGNVYPNPSNLHYVFSFESNNKVYITNCIFKDNGAVSRKYVYLTAYESALINLWSMTYSYLNNNLFVSSSKAELGSGFISSSPHGGVFQLYNSVFIILETNSTFRYKGILLDHFTEATMINNTFINLMCNNLSFIHMHGSVSLVGSSSYSYSQNSYFVVMENNEFMNCSCVNGGGLGIISIYSVSIKNCRFFNSTATKFSGHLLVISGVYLTLSHVIFNVSAADEGSGAYLRNFAYAKVDNIEIYEAFSRKNGVLFCRDIGVLEINSSFARNLISLGNGGFAYLFHSKIFINNLTVYNSYAEFEGGSLMITGNSFITISDCFIQNSSAYIGGAISFESANYVIVTNITIMDIFANLNGAGFSINSIKSLSFTDISITNGICMGNGIISLKTDDENVPLNLFNITCNNTKAVAGSCIYYLSSSKLNINHLIVSENGPTPIYIMWSYEVEVYLNEIFISNSNSSNFLIAIYGVKFVLSLCEISKNVALKNLFDLNQIQGEILELILKNNFGENAINLVKSELFIDNLQLTNSLESFEVLLQEKIYYLNLFYGENSQLSMNNSFISGIYSKRNSFVLFTLGEISLFNVKFEGNMGLLFSLLSVNIHMNSCVFFNNTSLDISKANDLEFDSNDLNNIYKVGISNCSFLLFTGFSLDLRGGLATEIHNNTLFVNLRRNTTGIYSILCENFESFTISSSFFYNFTASSIKFLTNIYLHFEFSYVFIDSCEFINSSAVLGSSLYFKGTFQIQIENCKFIGNKAFVNHSDKSNALQGIASCIFFKSENELFSKIQINSNFFENNQVEYLSPTIFSQSPLKLKDNFFTNNSDTMNFTTKAFSYPLKLIISSQNNTNNSKNSKNSIEIASGNPFKIEFQIQDYFNQSLIFDNSSIFTIKQLHNQASIIIENGLSQAENGKIAFQALLIKTTPNSYFSLILTGKFIGLLDNFNNEIKNSELSLEVSFFSRPCQIGEVITHDSSCFKCPPGKFSFIDPMITETKYQKCNDCPENCECFGGSFITPLPGFYRKSNISNNVVPCFNLFACLGYNDSSRVDENILVHGLCEIGNDGVLCFYCSRNYGKYDRTDYCKECADVGLSVIVRLVFYGILMIFYILLNFHLAEETHKKVDSTSNLGTFFKIIINHSQHMNIIIAGAVIPFPSFSSFFNQNDYFSFSNDHVITNDCIVQQVYYDPQTTIIFKEIFNTILPLAFSLLAFVTWIILNCFLGFSKRFKANLKKIPTNINGFISKSTIFVVLSTFIFYSLIVKSCFGLFDCMLIDLNDAEKYLRESPEIQCWGDAHIKYVIFFGMPGLLTWGMVFPLLLFYVLAKNVKLMNSATNSDFNKNDKSQKDFSLGSKKPLEIKIKLNVQLNELSSIKEKSVKKIIDKFTSNLDKSKKLKVFRNETDQKKFIKNYQTSLEYSKTFVFFYKDYQVKFFYWECLIFFRKFILTFFSVLSHTMNNEIRLIVMFIIIWIFYGLTNKHKPYKSLQCNELELTSMTICMISIFSSAVFASECKIELQYVVAVVCILSNLFFFVYAAYWIFLDARALIRKIDFSRIFTRTKKEKIIFNQKLEIMVP